MKNYIEKDTKWIIIQTYNYLSLILIAMKYETEKDYATTETNQYWELEWYWMEYWMHIYCWIDWVNWKYNINCTLNKSESVPWYSIYSWTFDKKLVDLRKLKNLLEEKAKEIDEFLYGKIWD